MSVGIHTSPFGGYGLEPGTWEIRQHMSRMIDVQSSGFRAPSHSYSTHSVGPSSASGSAHLHRATLGTPLFSVIISVLLNSTRPHLSAANLYSRRRRPQASAISQLLSVAICLIDTTYYSACLFVLCDHSRIFFLSYLIFILQFRRFFLFF